MTVTHQDIAQQGAAVRPYRSWEMPVAVVLSLFCPGLGVAALGVKDQVSRWEVTSASAGQFALLFMMLPHVLAERPPLWGLVLLAVGWPLVGTISAIRTLYLLPALRAGTAPRKTHYFGALFLLVYLLSGLALLATSERLTDLTLRTAPPGTALAPVGTDLIAIEPISLDKYVRGELIEFSTAQGPRLARVLAIGGDWFVPEVGGFVVNAHRYSVSPDALKVLHAPPYLDDLANPTSYRADREDMTIHDFVQTNPIVVAPDELIVASDESLMADTREIIETQRIETDDVLAVPLARLDMLIKGRSALSQPAPPFRFLFSNR